MNVSFELVTEVLPRQHNLVLIGSTPSFEMAWKKSLPYLLHPKFVAPDFTSFVGDDRRPLLTGTL